MDKEKILLGFKEYLKSHNFTKSTITGYFLDVHNFVKWQEDNKSSNVKHFIQHLRKNEIKPQTVNHHLYALKRFSDFLAQNNLAKEINITGLDDDLFYPTLDLTYIEFTKPDIDKFIAEVTASGNKRYIALVLLMAKAGLKISEALDLKLENISGSRIMIKNDERERVRGVKASKEVISAIQDYLKDRKGESHYLFNSNKSARLDRTVVNRFFQQYQVTPKQLRQYFIIQCLENNQDMENISKKAGIKSLQWIMSRYENMYYEPDKFNTEALEAIKEHDNKIIAESKKPKSKNILGIQLKVDYVPQATPPAKKPEAKPKPEIIKTEKKPLIEDWPKFIKDFNDFLYNFKMSNRTRPRLRTHGQTIRDDMEDHPEYKNAFQKICTRLPESILKNFKPMYRQGYFYLYEKEIIEISRTESLEEMVALLYESLRHMGAEEPVKTAKKILGLS
jgi:integrase/recombinase XerD